MTNYKNKIIKESKIIDFSDYNILFDDFVIKRGNKLFKDNKIKQLKISNNKYSCTIEGTQVYKLFIEFDENNNINKMKCNCPYYEKGNNCKHLYALLIETKLKDNYDKLIILKNKKLNKLKKQFKLYKEHLINNINKYTEYNQKIINIFIDYYEKELIPKYEKLDDNEMSQNEFLEMIEEMQYKINTMKDLYYEIKDKRLIITIPEAIISGHNVEVGEFKYIFKNDKYNVADELNNAFEICDKDLKNRTANDELILSTAKDNAISIIKQFYEPWLKKKYPDYELEVK